MKKLILLFTYFLSTAIAFGYRTQPTGIGKMAQNIMEPVSFVSTFVSNASLVIGICFLFGSFFRYLQFRENRMAAPLGSVLFLFFMGLVLVVLPYGGKLVKMVGG